LCFAVTAVAKDEAKNESTVTTKNQVAAVMKDEAKPENLVTRAADLPKTFPKGEALIVTPKLRASFFDLLKAENPPPNTAECSISCPGGIGAINCSVGVSCNCSCPGTYPMCECKT